MGKYNETINASEKAIEIDPLNASGWRIKGIALAWQDKRGEAIHAIDNAIEIDPQSALLRDGRIIILLRSGDIGASDNAIELNPQDAFAWLIKGGVAYYVSNQADESIQEVFDKAIDLDPNSSLAWYAKGYFYARFGKYNESIQA
jgi:tetratricopeptide (TPR) repeat protein